MGSRRAGRTNKSKTTIGIKRITKAWLDKYRAPGQCCDGFICQLIDLWERVKGKKGYYMTGSAGGNQGALV
jgi:hypothetical protein